MSKPNTLHLRRRIGESIVIGEGPNQVMVTVGVPIDDQVNLIFNAPREIQIDRLEIARKKARRVI